MDSMTGMELAAIAGFRFASITVVFGNLGYGIERPMLDDRFNDIHSWNRSGIPEILGAGKGFDIKSDDQLEQASQEVQKPTDSFSASSMFI